MQIEKNVYTDITIEETVIHRDRDRDLPMKKSIWKDTENILICGIQRTVKEITKRSKKCNRW